MKATAKRSLSRNLNPQALHLIGEYALFGKELPLLQSSSFESTVFLKLKKHCLTGIPLRVADNALAHNVGLLRPVGLAGQTKG